MMLLKEETFMEFIEGMREKKSVDLQRFLLA